MSEPQIVIENGRFVVVRGAERRVIGEQMALTIDGDADTLLGFGSLEEARIKRSQMAGALEALGHRDEAAAILVVKLEATSCPDEVLDHLNRALTTSQCGAVTAIAQWALTPQIEIAAQRPDAG